MSWFYEQNGEQKGPIPAEELVAKVRGGELPSSALVWREGLADWTPFSSVAELQNTGGISAASGSTPTENPAAASPYSPPTTNPSAGVAGASSLPPGATVPNYLWQSIVATLLCCLPFGVVGIVYASKVNGLVAQGDYAGAAEASKKAKLWTNISAGIGLLVGILSIVTSLLGAASAGAGVP